MNPTQPAVKVDLNGVDYSLRFDFEAIAKAEELTDKPLLTGLRNKDITAPTINLVRALLFACLLPDQPQVTYDQAKSFVNRKNLVDVWAKVLFAWSEGMAEPEPMEDAPADPTMSQR